MKQHTTLSAAALGVSRETEERLRAYLALLRRWNGPINLIADAPAEHQWQRHVLDSLQLLPLFPTADGPIVDLGSGAGLPGLVLALASTRETHLIESDRRKCAFLLEASRVLGANTVTVHPLRIEAAAPPRAAILTARALAPLPKLLGHAHRLLAADGVALLPKGRGVDAELTDALATWTMQLARIPSRTDPSATILRLKEIRPARLPT